MRKKRLYRAVAVFGVVHGGGGSVFGDWRNSYKKAAADLLGDAFKMAFSDSFTCIEVREEI